jgi:hypothetical protein
MEAPHDERSAHYGLKGLLLRDDRRLRGRLGDDGGGFGWRAVRHVTQWVHQRPTGRTGPNERICGGVRALPFSCLGVGPIQGAPRRQIRPCLADIFETLLGAGGIDLCDLLQDNAHSLRSA